LLHYISYQEKSVKNFPENKTRKIHEPSFQPILFR